MERKSGRPERSLWNFTAEKEGGGVVPAIFFSQAPETVKVQSHCLELSLYFVLPFRAFRLVRVVRIVTHV